MLNPCASFTRFYSHPAYNDFRLKEKDLEYISPDGNKAMIFDNVTCLCVRRHDRLLDGSIPTDPRTVKFQDTYKKILPLLFCLSQRSGDGKRVFLQLLAGYPGGYPVVRSLNELVSF